MTEPRRPGANAPPPERSKPVGKAGAREPGASDATPMDPRAAARARIEKALESARPRPVPSDPGPGGTTRRGRPATPPAHHWSQAVRQRVSDPESKTPSAPPPAGLATPEPAPESAGEVTKPEAPGESARERLRRNIEARLADTEARRREAPPPEPAPSAEDPSPVGDGADPGSADPGSADKGTEESSTDRWSLPDRPPASHPFGRRPRSRLAELVATCFLVGRAPLAPGTLGALLGLFAFAITRGLSTPVQVGLFVAAVLFGGWAAHRHALDLNAADPRSVVVDEFVGMWLALIALDPSWLGVLGAFLAFRALDILKPPPVNWAERLPDGFGIMADDLVAGGLVRLAFFFIG